MLLSIKAILGGNVTGAQGTSLDARTVEEFEAQADQWWNENGPFSPLHKLNPARLSYMREQALEVFSAEAESMRPFEGLDMLDVGCGGGLVTEPFARMGAKVTGIDAGAAAIDVANAHAEAMGLEIDYQRATVEQLAASGAQYDIVCALEIIEHVADPEAFIAALSQVIKPGGVLFMSTLNKTLKGLMLGVVAAEYLLHMVPRGTHDWRKFQKPSVLARTLRAHGVRVTDVSGIVPDLTEGGFRLSANRTGVNYILTARK